MGNICKIHGNIITLFTRERSDKIQARFRMPDGRPKHFSTNCADLDEAKKIAVQKYSKFTYMIEQKIPLTERRFHHVAASFISELDRLIDRDFRSETNKVYKGIIQNWLIPFFGNDKIAAVDRLKIREFEHWCVENYGKELSKSLINKLNIALRKIFDHAILKKWMNERDVPKLTVKDKGLAPNPRPSFKEIELKPLREFLQDYHASGRRWESKYKRKLLAPYVQFLLFSAIRPGTESEKLKWKHIQIVQTDDKLDIVQINMPQRKTAKRTVTCHVGALAALNEVAYRCRSAGLSVYLGRFYGGVERGGY